ncbi:hypothetical protein J2W32_000947 [Variovorax boronicumulans]|uniref:Uncharacterized protein n=1 Tax=Variovorax boronicumulans TaxID=436515 RepID=A0AAW8CXZ6_9BURK|nr:hypothetical protein [Variovorax boronicumulans]MDP9892608.1 hypothetical protein [Variovorax boronicumulans]MDQ0051911.1 hypothetical protein [Variovorax boronicumulans]
MTEVEIGPCFRWGDHCVVVTAARRGDGWWAWAEFMQDTEHSERPTLVPVYRHKVPDTFSTMLAAFEAAREYALRTVTAGMVAVH